jgi:hypothetical protein
MDERFKYCNLAKLIYAFRDLPSLPPILLDSDAEREVFAITKHKYQSASLWLRHILLGEALQREAYETSALAIQPFAEFLAANFRLAIAVYSRTTDPRFLCFGSPAEFWFCCVVVMSQRHLENTGLTGKPFRLGKREAWDGAVKISSKLRCLEYQPDPLPTFDKDPLTVLIVEAQALAKLDRNFYKDHLLPFIRTTRRSAKKNKELDNVQFYHLLPNGKLFVTGKNKKLPPLLK